MITSNNINYNPDIKLQSSNHFTSIKGKRHWKTEDFDQTLKTETETANISSSVRHLNAPAISIPIGFTRFYVLPLPKFRWAKCKNTWWSWHRRWRPTMSSMEALFVLLWALQFVQNAFMRTRTMSRDGQNFSKSRHTWSRWRRRWTPRRCGKISETYSF